MNVHCSYCRHSFNLTRDYLAYAIAEADEKRQKYHAVECPKCRKTIKVSVKQMRPFVPAAPVEEPVVGEEGNR
ncbi:MAG: hypothetical protein IAE79_00485 [Anaerolinea sp.]|nr:hypothetical protein [Anaerolinea sp.]